MENNHIIIGLGGTGGTVIKKFREQIVDKYGDIENETLNYIEYLYVDSNPTEFAEELWQYQGKNIKLHGNSTLVLKAGDLKKRLNDLSSRSKFLGRDEEWGDLLNDKELAEKAGNQMRRLGRANLIPNIKDIVDIVSEKQKKLTSNKDANTVIHIVTGLAGGTGSGSVLDVTTHLLKHFEKQSNRVHINLYLKIPEVQIPKDWGGAFSGEFGNMSFYQINGYAALKEINSLISGKLSPYDITTKRSRIKSINTIQSAYIISDRNNEGIHFKDFLSPIASLLFLKTITSETEKDNDNNKMSLPQTLTTIDTAENITLNPSAYWGLTAKFRVPGIYKIGVPKVQIRESFAYLLVLNAFNKLLYKNYDNVGGEGYLGVPPDLSEVQKEKNLIIKNLRSALLDEWFLTYDFLSLNEPMIDKNNKFITEGRDDYSFNVAYKKNYNKQYQLVFLNNIYKGKVVDDKEKMKYLQMAMNDYFNKDYKGDGYEKYYNGMLKNLSGIADFISYRIKDKMFGKEGGRQSRYYPMESYIDLLLFIIQDYMDALENDLKNKQLKYSKEAKRKQEELNVIKEDYLRSFGLFGSKSKRENTISNFNSTLEKFWFYTVSLKGINFSIQLIHSHLKNKLLDIKKEIENDIRKVVERRDSLQKEYIDEKEKLNGKDGIQGFEAITNDQGLEKFQRALMKNKSKFDEVIVRLEKLIIEHKDKVTKDVGSLKNKDLPIMKRAYLEIDDLLSEKNFRDLLGEDDQFYNAHVVEVLFNKFDADANNPKLKDLFVEMNKQSAPMATVDVDAGGGHTKEYKLVVLPELQGVKEKDTEITDFYNNLKAVLKETINAEINEIKDDKFKNEITIAQFYAPVRPDQIDNLTDLRDEYKEKIKAPSVKFLVHTENVGGLVDLIPPKSEIEYKNALLPYLLIINAANQYTKYGDNDYWMITHTYEKAKSSNSEHLKEEVDIYFESNSIVDFLKLPFEVLDDKISYNEYDDDPIDGFLHPYMFSAIQGKAFSLIENKDNADKIFKGIEVLLDDYLQSIKNDKTDKYYKQMKNAYKIVNQIINVN